LFVAPSTEGFQSMMLAKWRKVFLEVVCSLCSLHQFWAGAVAFGLANLLALSRD
jgi:hypothetical protein